MTRAGSFRSVIYSAPITADTVLVTATPAIKAAVAAEGSWVMMNPTTAHSVPVMPRIPTTFLFSPMLPLSPDVGVVDTVLTYVGFAPVGAGGLGGNTGG